jgi:hypothetical protein
MSKVSNANRALALIGANKITSLDDGTTEAKAINNMYADSLKSILSECCWNFAKKRKKLNLVTDTPAWGKGNYFQIPADCVRIFGATSDYDIEGNYLLTNDKEVGILYTTSEVDDNLFSPAFRDAFCCRLAYDVSYDLTNSTSKQDELLELYHGHLLPIAKSMNARNSAQKYAKDDAWINAINGWRGE